MTKTLRHAMIDLETMSLETHAAIVSIGVVMFDPRYGQIGEKLHLKLDWRNQPGRHLCGETRQFWKEQIKKNPELKKELNGKMSLTDALEELAFFLPSDCKVWGNGPLSDMGWLEHAYKEVAIDIPWRFYNVRDCRTIRCLYESLLGAFYLPRTGVTHSAIADAEWQARTINKMWKEIANREV